MRPRPFPRGWGVAALISLLLVRAGAAEMGPVVVKTLPDTLFLVVRKDEMPAGVAAFQQASTARLRAVIAASRLEQAGTLQFMGPKWNGMDKPSTYVIAVPVRARKPVPADVEFLDVPPHRVASMLNRGPGSSIAGAWDHLREVVDGEGVRHGTEWTEVQLEPKDSPAAESLIELQLGVD